MCEGMEQRGIVYVSGERKEIEKGEREVCFRLKRCCMKDGCKGGLKYEV